MLRASSSFPNMYFRNYSYGPADALPVRGGLAFIAFGLLASGVYAINDVRDVAEDRTHPRKRHRPVAAGELEPRSALALGAGLMLAGLALCVAIRPLLLAVGAGY